LYFWHAAHARDALDWDDDEESSISNLAKKNQSSKEIRKLILSGMPRRTAYVARGATL
jgi:hypothetical protein